jgi:cytochrome c peroxidase
VTIQEGQRLPPATLLRIGADGVEKVELQALTAGRRVALFALPGAFTPTCQSAHVPSFVRTAGGFAAKGVQAIYCLAVNDPWVMRAFGEATGATAAGIGMLADHAGQFTRAIGMSIDDPDGWRHGRSKRYAMLVEDGTVRIFAPEPGPGCAISGGEALLDAI